MSNLLRPVNLTPLEFEHEVKAFLERQRGALESFAVEHRESIAGSDGEYEIDVTVRFEALGADFLVVVECKQQSRAVERDVVQVLADRVRSIGAHKGMIFTTASYQSGALDYARAHGIALVRLADGSSFYMTRSDGGPPDRPPPATVPRCLCVLTQLDAAGRTTYTDLDALPNSLLELFRSGPAPNVGTKP
jgi:restriction system protein